MKQLRNGNYAREVKSFALKFNMAADTGMDTCPSPEITDSRKRPLDGDSENGDVKRSHFSSGESSTVYITLINYTVLLHCVFGKQIQH